MGEERIQEPKQRSTIRLDTRCLGQSGVRLANSDVCIYVDPYLSNAVQENEGLQGRRLVPAPMAPSEVTDADYIFVTHEHLDHWDPQTLKEIAEAAPDCRFMVPAHLCKQTQDLGIQAERVQATPTDWTALSDQVTVLGIPTSHPKVRFDNQGNPWSAGFLFQIGDKRCFVAGDTSLTADLLQRLEPHAPITAAFLPVNEDNYMRREAGIVANMSVREAFFLAERIGCRVLIPQHWDMFAANQVHEEEIRLLHQLENPPFDLAVNPDEVTL